MASRADSSAPSRVQQGRQQMLDAAAEVRGAGPLRLGLAGLGLLVILFGAARILQAHAETHPFALAKWLIGAVIVHDGIIAPITVGVGWAVARVVPGRARGFVQGALAVAGLATFIALPLIYRHGKGAPGTTLLQRAYGPNLLILFAVIALATAAAYLAQRSGLVRRPQARATATRGPGRPSSRKQRPWIDQ